MKKRLFWLQCIENYWKRSVLWISGVRRVGKTCLCQTIADVHYFDCELPRVRRMMEDPEGFWSGLRRQRVVLDEIHRLGNPSEMLKIAADHYPDIRIIATGSSRLGASAKFKDTLSGRKTDFWLTPMVSADLKDFGNDDLSHRLLRGGMPPFFLEDELPERDFQEWRSTGQNFELSRPDCRFGEYSVAVVWQEHCGGQEDLFGFCRQGHRLRAKA